MAGLLGIWNENTHNIGEELILGLTALQHRGQETVGVVIYNHNQPPIHANGVGYVREILAHLGETAGTHAIGYVGDLEFHIAPITRSTKFGRISACLDGQITNRSQLLEKFPYLVQTTDIDEEIILHVLATSSSKRIAEAMREKIGEVSGGISLLVADQDRLCAYRDPHGMRPLIAGKTPAGSTVFSSETCIEQNLGLQNIHSLRMDELNVQERGKEETRTIRKMSSAARCAYEILYLSMPNSKTFGTSIHQVRMLLGNALAKKWRVSGDIVVPVPASGLIYGLGMAEESGTEYAPQGIIRNHYTPRLMSISANGFEGRRTQIKLNANTDVVEGKKVILIDDTLVRGITAKKLIADIRHSGATEVHFGLPCPPLVSHCSFGVHMREGEGLLTEQLTDKESMRVWLNADSFEYLTHPEVKQVFEEAGHYGFCWSCLTGIAPY